MSSLRFCKVCGFAVGGFTEKQIIGNLYGHAATHLNTIPRHSPEYKQASEYVQALEAELSELASARMSRFEVKPLVTKALVVLLVLGLMFSILSISPRYNVGPFVHAQPGGPLQVTLTVPNGCVAQNPCVFLATATGGTPTTGTGVASQSGSGHGYLFVITYSSNAATSAGGPGLCPSIVNDTQANCSLNFALVGGCQYVSCGNNNPTITLTVTDYSSPQLTATVSSNPIIIYFSCNPPPPGTTQPANLTPSWCVSQLNAITATYTATSGAGSSGSWMTAPIYPGIPIPVWLGIVGIVGVAVSASFAGVHRRPGPRTG